MTENTPSNVADATGSGGKHLLDPDALRDRPDVEYHERAYYHDEADHCEANAAGRAIVGVTNEAGEVLLWLHENGHAILPNVVVEAGDDWAATALEDVSETAGLAVSLDGVERVREVDHVLETDATRDEAETDHLETTHHVVFCASPARPASERDGPSIDSCDDVWSADWYGEVPVDPDDFDEGGVLADIRLFLDEQTEIRDASTSDDQ